MKKFNKDFIFSTSTCAFQIEGARSIGGRKDSIWDKFTKENFYIPKEGEAAREINSIEVAADYYHRYEKDSKIMNKMGVNGFVYNLDGARVMPDDTGIPNEEGLRFYEDMFKSLVENGVKPIPILYHGDTPLWLEEKGGVSGSFFVPEFAKFVKVMLERLGKYTDIGFVNDENSTFTTSAYLDTYSPPQKNDPREFGKAIHNLNMSGAYAKIEFDKAKAAGFLEEDTILGIDHDGNPAIPYDETDEDDIKASKIFNEYNLDLFLDPNMLGTYPDIFYKEIAKYGLQDMVTNEDMDILKQNTLDLIGGNYYRPAIIASPKRMKEDIEWFNEPSNFITKEAYIVFPKEMNYTDGKGLIKPEDLVPGSKVLYKKYGKPLMIIENGMGYFDKKENGIVNDTYRIDFLNEHLKQVQIAIDEGVPFIGYSLGTYSDIFSPSGGYRKKYGLVGVDYEGGTLDRYPKSSFYGYQSVISNKSAVFGEIEYDKYKNNALEEINSGDKYK